MNERPERADHTFIDPLRTGTCKHGGPAKRCLRPIEEHERLVVVAGSARQGIQFMDARGFPSSRFGTIVTSAEQLRGLPRGRRVVLTGTSWTMPADVWDALRLREFTLVEEETLPAEVSA